MRLKISLAMALLLLSTMQFQEKYIQYGIQSLQDVLPLMTAEITQEQGDLEMAWFRKVIMQVA